MSLFRWFSRAPRHDHGTQASRHEDDPGARQSQRRERSARREQLYVIVREAMVRVGILSAGYKFKVLSLDNVGQRFVVMVDLAPAYAADASQQRRIEALIAELARTRMDAGVHAVYWRVNGQLQTAATPDFAQTQFDGLVPPMNAQRQALLAAAAPAGRAFEPIDAQEMDAFKQAVAMASASPAGSARPSRQAPLLGPGSGHEEGGEFAVSGLGSLGATQYGELR
ncbi:MAG: hypothetical protein LBV05_17120 [Comamonas sp.]|jgi:hypothetical protein|uniref:hypothetical protein n=1 Tax=Comamonas sp. TaxID=34028 RepID=UPI00283F1A16|nr:hypothetical protein [Comamonas sp.]MDR3067211.1 hypothetical protein [Comamonas sp.]